MFMEATFDHPEAFPESMSKPSPAVSVIIPTHNRAEMLKRSAQSVLDQTFRDFELIIVSDGSLDHTDEVTASFADSRIRYLKHPAARGASAARNTGIQASTGKYLAFLDDDDIWLPQKLEVQVKALENAGDRVGLVYNWIEYFQDGKLISKRHPTLRGDIFHEMLDRQAITNSSALLIKREVISVIKGWDEELPRGNDGDFIRRITQHFEVECVPQVLTKLFVGHPDRISVNSDKNLRNAIHAFEKRLKTFHGDFERHPAKKANVLAEIALYQYKVGEMKRFLTNFGKALRCNTNFPQKFQLTYTTFKKLAKYILENQINLKSPFREKS